MNKENLQAELDGLKLTLNNIKQTISVDGFNRPQSSTDKFKALHEFFKVLHEFFDAVYDLQNKTVTQSRISTPQEPVGVDLLTDAEAEQIIKDALGNRGIPEVAELLEKFEGVDGVHWYCYDTDTKQLFNACQYNVIELVFDNIQTAING